MLKLVPSISTHGFFITGLSKSLSAVFSFQRRPIHSTSNIFSTFGQVFANSSVFFNFSSTNSAEVAIAIVKHVQQFQFIRQPSQRYAFPRYGISICGFRKHFCTDYTLHWTALFNCRDERHNRETKQKVLDPCHRATGVRLSYRGRQKLNFSREQK